MIFPAPALEFFRRSAYDVPAHVVGLISPLATPEVVHDRALRPAHGADAR